MKKLLSVFMTVLLLLTVIAPAVSFTGYGAFSLEIDDGGYINSQLAAYSSHLSEIIDDYEGFRSYVVSCMKNCQTPIDISSYHISRDYKDYLSSAIFYDMTEAFHVSGGYSYSYNKTTNYVTKLNINYNMTKSEYDAAFAMCDDVSNSFVADLVNNNELSQAEKALIVHDRLDQWCEYDTANYYSGTVSDLSHEMYGAFVDGVAVCSGYSRAYKYTLAKLGIDSYLCDSDNMNHEWNIVIIDGVKYHVDTTWDDPSWDVYGRVNHTNFLRSTNGIIATGHDGGDFDTSPTDTRYDSYFWQCSKTEFQYKNGIFYYYDTTNKQLKKIEDGTTSVLKTFTDKWRASSSGYYAESYLRLDSDNSGDYLFYSTPEHIMKYDLETGTSTIAYTPELPANYYWIYGFKAQNNHFYIDIIDYPNADSETRKSSLCVRYQDDPVETHTVTYNFSENGGISASETSLDVEEGATVDLTPTAVKPGWNFRGWNTDPNASEGLSALEMGGEDVTLYAIFDKDIHVTYYTYEDADGYQSYDYTYKLLNKQTYVDVQLKAVTPPNGFTGLGWAETTDPNDTLYSGTQRLSDSKTYYAVYGKELTLSYNLDGGTGSIPSSNALLKVNAIANTSYPELRVSYVVPQKAGFFFNGWLDEGYTSYIPGEMITLYDNTQLTARFEANTYGLTLNENYIGGSTSNKTVTFGSAIGELPVPVRNGYDFGGWFTAAEGGTQYTSSTVYNDLTVVNLFAHWTPKQNIPYTVEHYVAGFDGTFGDTPALTETFTGTAFSEIFPAELASDDVMVTGGIEFSYPEVDGEQAFITTINPDGTTVVKLYYTRVKHTVSVMADPAIMSVSGEGEYYYGQTVTVNVEMADGYNFKCWQNGNNVVSADPQYSFIILADDCLLSVTFEKAASFSVKAGSTAVISKNGQITGLKTELSLSQLKSQFLDYEGVDVVFTKAVKSSKFYGTGSTVEVTYPDGKKEVYTIVIYGDVDGNGSIDKDDAGCVAVALEDDSALNTVQQKAADIDGIRRIGLNDLSALYKVIEGVELNQVNPSK